MNQITVAGHLGADPEVRFTSSGKKVTTFRVAARSRRSGKEETIWWKVTIWGEQFDKILPYFKKGHPIIVLGELSPPEIFTDREGRSQVSMNITAQHIGFSPFGRADGQSAAEPQPSRAAFADEAPASTADVFQGMPAPSTSAAATAQGQGKADMNFSDDEIPF
jgi:single-strand DNA-binding protein